MALVFPASPINGQTYTSGGVTYTWDTVKWSAGIVNAQAVDLSSTQTITGAKTFGATLTATGGISMANTTSNLLLYSSTGVAAPTAVTRSAGTKIVLYPSVGIGTADYAIGIENFTLWNSVVNAANGLFKWYGGTTLAATLSGTGNLTVVGTVSGTNITTGGNVTGSSASCSGNAATATTATNVSNGTVSATSGTFSGAVGIGGVPTAVKLEVLSTDAILVPKGTTVEQPTGVAGYLRFNTTTSQFEGYNGSAWGSIGGGATGAGVDQVFVQNSMVITASYSLPVGKSASSVGAITINSGVVVTIPTGSKWVVL